MGEAANRKGRDARYGRIPKDVLTRKRGVVVSLPTEISADQMSITFGGGPAAGSRLDPQELRYSLLFWDEVAWPVNNLIHVESAADELFLERAGILRRPRVEMVGSFTGAEIVTRPHLQAFWELEAREPGKWSLALGERSLNWQQAPLGTADAAVVELLRAIPVPDADVPLEEILEFKEKRADELLALRAEIDTYVAAIVGAADPAQALVDKSKYVERACVDLLKAGHSWKFPVRLTDLKVTVETKPGEVILKALGANVIGAHMLNLDAITAFLSSIAVGALSSGVKIAGTPKLQRIRPRKTPYEYVYSFHKELF